jgi:hypothetical protein
MTGIAGVSGGLCVATQSPAKGKSARLPRKRIAAGPPRPKYLGGDDVDRLAIMMVAMLSEVLALRERVESHEDLLDSEGLLAKAKFEEFRPSPDQQAAREEKRLAILRRVFRVLRDEFADYDFQEDEA